MSDEGENKLIAHLVTIVELVTQEIKELKSAVNTTDKDLALIDQRLKYAEELVSRIREIQSQERLATADRVGGDRIKWLVLGALGTGLLGTLFKLIPAFLK